MREVPLGPAIASKHLGSFGLYITRVLLIIVPDFILEPPSDTPQKVSLFTNIVRPSGNLSETKPSEATQEGKPLAPNAASADENRAGVKSQAMEGRIGAAAL